MQLIAINEIRQPYQDQALMMQTRAQRALNSSKKPDRPSYVPVPYVLADEQGVPLYPVTVKNKAVSRQVHPVFKNVLSVGIAPLPLTLVEKRTQTPAFLIPPFASIEGFYSSSGRAELTSITYSATPGRLMAPATLPNTEEACQLIQPLLSKFLDILKENRVKEVEVKFKIPDESPFKRSFEETMNQQGFEEWEPGNWPYTET